MDSHQNPQSGGKWTFLNGALFVGVVTVLLGAVLNGAGFLVNRDLESDRTNLGLTLDEPIQAVPLLGKNPTWYNAFVGCEVVRLELTLAHNQDGKKPILVRELELETEPVPLTPSAAKQLAYEIDELESTPHGIVKVHEYRFVLHSGEVSGSYVRSRTEGDVVAVEPRNLLRTVEGSQGVTLAPELPDAHHPMSVVLEAKSPGLYRARFRVTYQISKEQHSTHTSWTYLYRKFRE